MIAHVVAISKNNCIGTDNDLPWHLPEDMKHFKAVTMGKIVLMGRKTWESIPKKFRPLPGRKNIVITRQEDYAVPDDVAVFHTISDALAAHKDEDIMIIGGGSIYAETMNIANMLYVTHVDKEVAKCDTFYPAIEPEIWENIDQTHDSMCTWVTYRRK